MSNKSFFNSFMKKDKLWNDIQSNPIAKESLMPHYNLVNFDAYLQSNHHNDLVGRAAAYNRQIRFHPLPAARHRVRIPLGNFVQSHNDWKKNRLPNQGEMREIVDSKGRYPAAGVALANPLAGGLAPAVLTQRIEDNIDALYAIGHYRVEIPNRRDYPNDWKNSQDYWLPHYEGDFMRIAEKESRTQAKHYNKDMKFLSNNFMSAKQNQAFSWLKADLT